MAPPDVSTPLPLRSPRRTSGSNPNAANQETSPQRSRRTSAVMGPPPLPNHSSFPSSPRPAQATIVSPTMERQPSEQGPIRHPRPLTAAELHLELEKEQESIVNRLTRELSALRAQTASVASTTSSTSDLFTSAQTLPDPYSSLPSSSSYGGVSIIPTSARRHRSSSNLSARSSRSARDAIARDNTTTSVSGVAAPRESERSHGTSGRQSLDVNRDAGNTRPEGSRQNSYSLSHSYSQNYNPSTSASGAGGGSMGPGITMYRSPSQTMSSYGGGATSASPAQIHRTSSASHNHSRNHSTSLSLPASQMQPQAYGAGTEGSGRSPSTSFGSAHAAARYEEAAIQRSELEAVRRENEALRQRVRELERLVSTVGLGASASASTPASQTNGSRTEQTAVGT